MMIARIMKHEWLLLTREKILYIALPVYALLLAYGVMTGTSWKAFLAANAAEAQQQADTVLGGKVEQLDRILAGEVKASFLEDPRLAAPLARYKGFEMATKPPAPTAAIAIGQSDVSPTYLKVQWKAMFKQTNTDEIENPENLAVGAFDLSFVLVYLYPLLIIALSYNILASERENGTQALLLSQPVSVAQFVAGKILLRGTLVIGLAVTISILGLLIGSPDILAEGDLWRVAVLALILLLYGAFWFGLAVLVNAFGLKSATNALIMMAVWIGVVLIVPGALNLGAKILHPLPSRIEMVQSLRRGEDLAQNQSGFSRAYRADLLRQGQEEALEASTNDFYRKILPLENKGEEIAAPIFHEFQAQRAAQQAFADKLKYLSPAAVMQVALSELANHSASDFNDFAAQVDAYHQRWRSYFLPAVMTNRLLTREELRDIPRFAYRMQPDRLVFSSLIGDALALLIFAGLAVGGGFAFLRKYPAAGR